MTNLPVIATDPQGLRHERGDFTAMESDDFIIVEAGSAACFPADHPASFGRHKVLLNEADPAERKRATSSLHIRKVSANRHPFFRPFPSAADTANRAGAPLISAEW